MKPTPPSPPKSTPRPAPTKPSWLRRLGLLSIVASLVGAVAGALAFIERRPDYLCRHWEAAACTAEPARVRQLVAKLDAYGSFGIPSLVRLLTADETLVAETARNALKRRLERAARGESLADEAAAVQVGDQLDFLLQQRSDATPRPVVDTALALLEATGGMAAARRLDADQRTKLIRVCDEALRRAAAPPSPLVAMLPSPEAATAAIAPAGEPTRPRDAAKLVPATAAAAVTGAVSSAARANNVSAASISSPVRIEEPRSAANAAARIEPQAETIVDSAVRPVSTVSSSTTSMDTTNGNPLRRGDLPTPLSSSSEKEADDRSGDDPAKLDAWALFAEVDVDPRSFAELRRRGFSPREIDVGRHLASRDPLERRRYAQMLPSLAGVEIRPWLLHLCDDADVEVRRAAATIMATTNDPTLLERLRSMSLEDADDGVREIAARSMDRETLRR